MKKIPKRIIVSALVVILAICGLAFYIHSSHYQHTDDAYLESHMVQVAPKVSGQIIEVYIDDNDKVKAGDLVAKIDPADYKVRYDELNAQYEKTMFQQSVAKANLNAANSEIELAQKDLNRYRKLYEAGAVSKQILDSQQTKYDLAVAHQHQAQNDVFSNAKNKVADADLKRIKAQKDLAKLNLSYTNIYAPQDGYVTNKRVEKGAYVQQGQSLFTLVSEETWVVANFKESQLANMKPGQEVEIKIDTFGNKVFKGKVDSIQKASGAKSSLFPPENAVGSFVKIVQRIPVKIVFTDKVDSTKYKLIAGMSCVPKVKVK